MSKCLSLVIIYRILQIELTVASLKSDLSMATKVSESPTVSSHQATVQMSAQKDARIAQLEKENTEKKQVR